MQASLWLSIRDVRTEMDHNFFPDAAISTFVDSHGYGYGNGPRLGR